LSSLALSTTCRLKAVIAVVSRSLARRYGHLSKINMAAALTLYRTIWYFLYPKRVLIPYLMVFLNSTFSCSSFRDIRGSTYCSTASVTQHPVTWWTCVSQLQATFIDAFCVLLCVAASSFHRRRQSVTVHAALLSLGRQREMRYRLHYATTNSLPCHFVTSSRLTYTLEHIIHTSTLVTVFTVRVGEHNFIVLTYLLTFISGPCAAWTPPSGKVIVPEASTLPHLIVFLISTF